MYKYKYMSMYLCIFVLKNFYSSIHFIYLFFRKSKCKKTSIIIVLINFLFNKNYYIIIFIKKSF